MSKSVSSTPSFSFGLGNGSGPSSLFVWSEPAAEGLLKQLAETERSANESTERGGDAASSNTFGQTLKDVAEILPLMLRQEFSRGRGLMTWPALLGMTPSELSGYYFFRGGDGGRQFISTRGGRVLSSGSASIEEVEARSAAAAPPAGGAAAAEPYTVDRAELLDELDKNGDGSFLPFGWGWMCEHLPGSYCCQTASEKFSGWHSVEIVMCKNEVYGFEWRNAADRIWKLRYQPDNPLVLRVTSCPDYAAFREVHVQPSGSSSSHLGLQEDIPNESSAATPFVLRLIGPNAEPYDRILPQPGILPQTTEELSAVFGPHSVFSQNFNWDRARPLSLTEYCVWQGRYTLAGAIYAMERRHQLPPPQRPELEALTAQLSQTKQTLHQLKKVCGVLLAELQGELLVFVRKLRSHLFVEFKNKGGSGGEENVPAVEVVLPLWLLIVLCEAGELQQGVVGGDLQRQDVHVGPRQGELQEESVGVSPPPDKTDAAETTDPASIEETDPLALMCGGEEKDLFATPLEVGKRVLEQAQGEILDRALEIFTRGDNDKGEAEEKNAFGEALAEYLWREALPALQDPRALVGFGIVLPALQDPRASVDCVAGIAGSISKSVGRLPALQDPRASVG